MQAHSLMVCHTKDRTKVLALKSQPGAHTLETSMCTDHNSLPHPYTPQHLLKPPILHQVSNRALLEANLGQLLMEPTWTLYHSISISWSSIWAKCSVARCTELSVFCGFIDFRRICRWIVAPHYDSMENRLLACTSLWRSQPDPT